MRAVIDTNVLLSGLPWRGAPHALIEHVQAGTLAMVSSPALLAEVISRAKFDEILGLEKLTQNNAPLKNRKLYRQLQGIERLPKRDQQALLRTIDAFLSKAS